mgnify:CR=1 FL=1
MFFSEKWSFSKLKNVLGFMMIKKLYQKELTPGRYLVPKFWQPKINGVIHIWNIFIFIFETETKSNFEKCWATQNVIFSNRGLESTRQRIKFPTLQRNNFFPVIFLHHWSAKHVRPVSVNKQCLRLGVRAKFKMSFQIPMIQNFGLFSAGHPSLSFVHPNSWILFE